MRNAALYKFVLRVAPVDEDDTIRWDAAFDVTVKAPDAKSAITKTSALTQGTFPRAFTKIISAEETKA